MTREEWADFCAEVDNTFKGDLDENKEAAYARHLVDLNIDLARAAVRLLVSEGLAFMPAPGEIAAAVRRLVRPDAPPFSEAWPVIAKALDRLWLHYGSAEEKARRKLQLVTEVHTYLGEGPARWVERTAERLVLEQPDDPVWGGAVMQRLGVEYGESCRQAEEDGRAKKALERAKVGRVGPGRPALRRINPARSIPQLPSPDAA